MIKKTKELNNIHGSKTFKKQTHHTIIFKFILVNKKLFSGTYKYKLKVGT